MKRLFTMILAVLFCFTVILSGCGQADKSISENTSISTKSSTAAVSKEESNLTPAGTFPIVKEKVTLRVWSSPPSWIGDLNENSFTKYFEEKTNIHIEWIRANMEEHWDKLNLVLASQSDMPEVFLSWGITNAQQIIYGTQGIFLPLNDLIEKYGVATKKVFDYNTLIKKSITAPDGKIYGLPALNESFHSTYSHKIWINQKWLNNLNLAMPATTDEFYNVLKAFKENDPNKNGKKDEVPLTKGSWQGLIDLFLMNAFIYNEGGNRLILKDDKVVQAPIQPEWKEGLKFLHKLYAEGLMDPEIFLADDNKVKLLTGAKDGNRVGAVASGALGFVDQSTPVKEEYVALPPLTGPNGVRLAKQYPLGMGYGNFVITRECKNPEVAFRFGDAIYQAYIDQDTRLWGEEGVSWEKAKPGDVGLDGKPAKVRILIDGQQPNNWTWSDGLNTFLTAELRNSIAVVPGVWNHEKILYDETKSKYEGLGPKQVMPVFFMPEKESAEWNEINTTINKYLEESIAQFVTGNKDIDKEWDNYVNELKKMGYDRLTELTQQAYDRQYKGQ